MHRRLTSTSLALALALGARVVAAQPPAHDEARGLDNVELALDRAVARVSRASVQVAQRGSSTRGYLLAGYGVLFVVPPRALPLAARSAADAEAARALQQAARPLEEALRRVNDRTLRLRLQASLEALRAAQGDLRSGSAAHEAQMEAVERQMQAEMEAMQRDAERFQADAERAMDEMGRELRSRLAPLPRPATDVAAPVKPGASAPTQVVAPEAPHAPPAPPAPPWSYWFEIEDESGSEGPDRLVRDVGAAVAEVFEAKGASLVPVKSDEYLAAAVDFFPRGAFAPRTRPQRTLLVRVKKQDLLARQAGRLTPEELRRHVEFVEY